MTPTVTPPPTPQTPRRATEPAHPSFDTRGARLWRELTADAPLGPTDRVLVEEACRIADRLDKLDDQLRGRDDSWLRVIPIGEDGPIIVVVDKALAEARQQELALKAVLAELRQSRTPVAPTQPTTTEESTGVADLTARIAARRSSPTG